MIRTGRTAAIAASALALAGAAAFTAESASASFGGNAATLHTYSTAVPADAAAFVQVVRTSSDSTRVILQLQGFAPNTTYGAHAHVNSCSPTSGAAAGPHYQYVKDPVSPSTNPAYANPRNEIWLDTTTNAAGNGTAVARVDWTFPADRKAKSVILHAEPTRTGPNDSGVAGARLACIDVAF